MANIVNLDRVTKAYGTAGTLLSDVSLGLDDSDRVGVVGLNGSGKSTLLKLLTKEIEPDSGRVTHRRDLRVLWLPQAMTFADELTVRDVVIGSAWLPA
jgi:ATP-binding cassette subfamily F protein uup